MSVMFVIGGIGDPLKGESREKTPLLCKKVPFFAWRRHYHQHGLVFTPSSHPSLLLSLVLIVHRPAPVTHRDQDYCYAWRITSHTAPVRCSDPENRRFHAMSNRMYYKSYGY